MMKNLKLLIPLILTIAFVGCQSGENNSSAKKAVSDQEVAQAKSQLEELGIEISDQSLLEKAEKGETETVSLLLKAGVSPDVTDNNNNSPLMLATNRLNTETAIALIEAGADLNLSGQRGRTALMQATISGSIAVLNALIQGGADLNAKDNKGNTALKLAKEFPQAAKAEKILIEAGAKK